MGKLAINYAKNEKKPICFDCCFVIIFPSILLLAVVFSRQNRECVKHIAGSISFLCIPTHDSNAI